MKQNELEKNFEEAKQQLQEALDMCRNYDDLRLYMHKVLVIAAEDYKYALQETKLVKVLEKINEAMEKEKNEKV